MNAALDMLPARILSTQRQALAVRQDTQPAAYEAYIRGRGYLQEYEKPENIDNAIAEFNQAIKIDPKYAPAYAGLGEAYLDRVSAVRLRVNEWVTDASANCEKALSLNPELSGRTCLPWNVLQPNWQVRQGGGRISGSTTIGGSATKTPCADWPTPTPTWEISPQQKRPTRRLSHSDPTIGASIVGWECSITVRPVLRTPQRCSLKPVN